MRHKPITAAERVKELVAEHGSLRKAGAATGIDFSRLCKISRGHQVPHRSTLDRLGLREIITYVRA